MITLMPDIDAHVAGLVTWSREVRAAVRRLEPTQSRVLGLIYFERRTQAQIAVDLKLSPGAVARAVAAGMHALTIAMLATAVE